VAEIERMTITGPSDMATLVKGAVEGDDCATSGEVLRDWKTKHALQFQELPWGL
jgi:hypothetical protein